MLHALYTVLENGIPNAEPIYILAPTAVVHTFCRNHRECDENEAVKDYVNLLETNTLERLETDLSLRKNREKVCLSQQNPHKCFTNFASPFFLLMKMFFFLCVLGDSFTSWHWKYWNNDKSVSLQNA